MVNLEIPSETPLGKKIERIGVWMSGGADSSLLCYLLAKKIKEDQLDCKLVPLTIDYKRPYAFIAVSVREKIEELLDCKDVFLPHKIYHPPEDVTWTTEELAEQFHIRNFQHFKNGDVQMLFSGITTNPPRAVQETFNYGILEDVEAVRGEGVEKETRRYFVKYGGEFLELKPFFDVNKKEIAKIYNEHNLMETIFPLTRSCEHIGTSTGHCGECWWCQERLWAFGAL